MPTSRESDEARESDEVGESDDEARPDDAFDPAVIEAIGKASEALEYVERARGHLYSMHQLVGRADFLFGETADMLRDAGLPGDAEEIDTDIVGRNVLDGRWTFQIVEEFDRLYWGAVTEVVRRLEADHLQGRRHVYESMLKEERRTTGRAHHESRPPGAHDPDVVTS